MVVLLFVFYRPKGTNVRGPFVGQVVDAETGQPIAGAIVSVYWSQITLSVGGSTDYELQEVVAGPDGRFTVPGLSRIWRPLVQSSVGVPQIDFYAVGYQWKLPRDLKRLRADAFVSFRTISMTRVADPRVRCQQLRTGPVSRLFAKRTYQAVLDESRALHCN
jgi:hypothetical protein